MKHWAIGHTLESFPQLRKAEKCNLLRLSLLETERVVKGIKFYHASRLMLPVN